MKYFLDVKIDPKDHQEALESMWADILENADGQMWTAIIGTSIGDKPINLFIRNNYKTCHTAEVGMEAAWNKLKRKFNTDSQKAS